MRNQKGLVQILLIVGIVAALAVIGFVFYRQKLSTSTAGLSMPVPSSASQAQYSQGTNSAPQIKNSSDLNAAANTLNSADTAQIDSQLNALNSVSGGF